MSFDAFSDKSLYLTWLKSPLVDMRRAAVSALMNQKDEKTVLALIEATQDEDKMVRQYSIKALGYTKHPLAFDFMLDLFTQQHQPEEVRALAAEALGNLENQRAVSSLLQVVTDPNENQQVRFVAAIALSHFKDEATTSQFIKIVQDKTADIYGRAQLLFALSQAEDTEKVVQVLAELLKEENTLIHHETIEALRRITHPQAAALLKQLHSTKAVATNTPGQNPESTYNFAVYADHYAFYLLDSEIGMENMYILDSNAFARAIDVGPGVICILAARYDFVPVEVAIFEKEPDLEDFGEYDQITDTSIEVPSGTLWLGDGLSMGEDAHIIKLPTATTYRARIYYGGLETAAFDNPEGQDFYRIVLWPGEAHEIEIIKKYTHPLAEQYQSERGW